jgi:hypothetical protein
VGGNNCSSSGMFRFGLRCWAGLVLADYMSLVREVEKVGDVMAVMQLQSLSKSVVQNANPTKWNIRSRRDVKHSAQLGVSM